MFMAFTKNPLQDGTKTKLSDYSDDLETRILSAFGVDGMTRGSNSNGTWIRWENGLQVCMNNISKSFPINITEGSMFISDLLTWNYPKEFTNVLYANASNDTAGLAIGMTIHIRNSYTSYRMARPTSVLTIDRGVVLFAIGFWK